MLLIIPEFVTKGTGHQFTFGGDQLAGGFDGAIIATGVVGAAGWRTGPAAMRDRAPFFVKSISAVAVSNRRRAAVAKSAIAGSILAIIVAASSSDITVVAATAAATIATTTFIERHTGSRAAASVMRSHQRWCTAGYIVVHVVVKGRFVLTSVNFRIVEVAGSVVGIIVAIPVVATPATIIASRAHIVFSPIEQMPARMLSSVFGFLVTGIGLTYDQLSIRLLAVRFGGPRGGWGNRADVDYLV